VSGGIHGPADFLLRMVKTDFVTHWVTKDHNAFVYRTLVIVKSGAIISRTPF
jgi:hypothetical protein